MDIANLSDDALRLWGCYFLTKGNTLRFGGDHAEMEITAEARNALRELIEVGAVEAIEPNDQWPGREHYGSAGIDLRPVTVERGGGTPDAAFKWLTETEFVTFRKKAKTSGESGSVELKLI